MHQLPTFGVEEEFLLVDPDTGEPAPCNREVAAEAKRRGTTLQLELSSCQVETTSSVAASSAELGVDLRSGLASAIRKAASSSRSVTRPGSTAKDGGPAWPVRS